MNRVVRNITEGVALRHGITVEDIISRKHHKKWGPARHEAFYMVRQFDPKFYSYPLIGLQFERDHSTILMGVRSHLARMEDTERLAA